MISGLIKGWWRTIGDAVESEQLVLVTSPQLIDEFLDVVSRPSKQSLLDPADAAEVANLLRRATVVVPQIDVTVCRDPNDNFLLALALAAQADVLVTRDEDLLTLRSYGQTEIIHVAEFFHRLSSPR